MFTFQAKHLLLLFLVLSSFLAMIPIQHAQATEITLTQTFITSTNDGIVANWSTNYYSAGISPVGTVYDSDSSLPIGQEKIATTYYIYRGFFFFDLTSLPSTANITAATASFYISIDSSTVDFNLTIQHPLTSAYPHDPLVPSDYHNPYASVTGGSRNTTTITGSGFWNISLTSVGLPYLSKTEPTVFIVRSSRDRGANIPGINAEFLDIAMREMGAGYAAKLYVTYITTGIQYVVHGPYYEDGTVALSYVNLTLSQPYNSTLHYGLNGTDSVADTLKINLTRIATAFSWNITTGLNHTKVFFLKPSLTYEELYIFVPRTTEQSDLCYFSVAVLGQVTNCFLESIINVQGNERISERQSITSVSAVTFWLTWNHRYTMKFVCDQGSYVFDAGFLYAGTRETNYVVLQSMFPPTYVGGNITMSAVRRNATWIQANYTDYQALTVWCNIQIQYRNYGSTTYVDAYSTNNTGSSHRIDWYSASNTTAYRVVFTALHDGATDSWSYSLAAPPYSSNPWDGLFEAFGSWPIPANQIFATALILGTIGIFSYWHVGIGCAMGFIMAALMWAIGWFIISETMLAISAVLITFILIDEWREAKRMRGLEA